MNDYFQRIDTKTKGPRCDVTPVFADYGAFSSLVDDLLAHFADTPFDCVAAIDALGFILGAAMAIRAKKGFVPIRKGGKLPVPTVSARFVDYTNQEKSLELRADAIAPGTRVLLVDEWIETGAQVQAAIQLIERQGGFIAGVASINIDDNEVTRRLRQEYHCFAPSPVDPLPKEIRTAGAQDLPCVRMLYDSLYEYARANPLVGSDVGDESLEERLCEFFLVAESGNQIIGFVIGAAGPVDDVGRAMAQDAFPDEGPYLEVQDLFVAPEYRNRGVGSALMHELVARGQRMGLRRAVVYSANLDYADIGRFYEKFGFVPWHLFLMRPPEKH